MKGFKTNIQELIDHKDVQTVLCSGLNLQLNLIVLKIGESSTMATAQDTDLVYITESGIGRIQVGSIIYEVCAGDLVLIPAGLQYKIMNVDDSHHLRLFSVHATSLQGWIKVEPAILDVATAFLALKPYLGLNV
jgi:mannose-6-phosphate isomerase-like protein (cupin superfamily)